MLRAPPLSAPALHNEPTGVRAAGWTVTDAVLLNSLFLPRAHLYTHADAHTQG